MKLQSKKIKRKDVVNYVTCILPKRAYAQKPPLPKKKRPAFLCFEAPHEALLSY